MKKKKYKFSIVVAVYNAEKYLDETINSIINQDIGFKENVQLIIVDDGSTDNSYDVTYKYQRKYPNNILLLSKENGGQSSARNLGLKFVSGEYINFLDSDDKLSSNTLRETYTFFKNNEVNIIAIPLVFFGSRQGDHKLNKKFYKNRIVDVYHDFSQPQLSISSCFIKSELFNDFSFDERFNIGEDAVLINKILINEGKIAFIKNAQYLYRKRDDESSTLDTINLKKEFYLDKSRYFHIELINYCLSKIKYVPEFIQYTITYDLQWYYNGVKIFDVLSKEEYCQLMDEINYILNYIDEKIIINHEYLTRDEKSFLIYLKNRDFHIVARPKKNKVFLKSNEFIINRLHNHKIHIEDVSLNEGILQIRGFYGSNCNTNFLSIIGLKIHSDGHTENFNAEYIEFSDTYKRDYESLNILWKFYYNFVMKIPVESDEIFKIELNINYNENENFVNFAPKVNLKDYCNLSNEKNYLIQNRKLIIFKDNLFYVLNYSKLNKFKLVYSSLIKKMFS